jgi:LysR family transcriptional regulator, regulator for bpeEF and oprC
MDRFDTMLAFTRVVELNSFTKASVSLNLPKTTLSAQIHALEKRLHVKLLHRTTRHISVTPEGADYYERAVRLLNELEETEAALTSLTTAPRGRLRIDIPSALGHRVIVPALSDFMRRYPEIELEVCCTDRQVDLLQEGVDCVIRAGTSVDDSLVARRLGASARVTCASPDYLRQFGIPSIPSDLERHDIVYYESPRFGKVYGFKYIQDGNPVSIFGKRRITFNDSEACVLAALDGIGLIQFPEFIVREYIATGQLQAVLEDQQSEALPFSILYPQNRHLSTKVRAFVEWSVELFARRCSITPASDKENKYVSFG